MTYGEAVAYLTRFETAGIKLGLTRIERLCAAAGHPERAFRSVLVGGTNGKGSVCTMLAAILEEAGLQVGLSPKPHLYDLRERFQVNGRMIEPAEFAAIVTDLASWLEADPSHEWPTWFEAMTLIAFSFFARRRVDWAVVEVGLGGRFDATNVLEPELAVITNVTLDHTDRLGDTVEAIAFEKAGILKPRASAITGATGAALGVIEQAAAQRGVRLQRLGKEILLSEVLVDETGVRFEVETRPSPPPPAARVPGLSRKLPGEGELVDGTGGQSPLAQSLGEGPGVRAGAGSPLGTPVARLADLHTPMLGAHQAANGALAAAAALHLRESLSISDSAIRAGLARARIAGRLEVLRHHPTLLIDGAHNPDAARRLRETLEQLFRRPGRRLTLVFGALRTHPYAQVVDELAPAVDHVIATQPQHPHAVPAEELADRARALGTPVEIIEPVPAAVRRALEAASHQDVVCIAGSFYVLAEVPRETGTS